MPKNKGAGGKNRKKGKNESDDVGDRELIFAEDGQTYAQITKILGSNMISAYCIDDVHRRCHIRGKMCRKVWLSVGDVILVSLRDFEKDIGDVIHKYLPNEIKNLKIYGELPDKFVTDNETNKSNNNDDIVFDVSDSDDE